MTERLTIVHVIFSRGFAGTERSTAESCNTQCEDHDITLICSTRHRRKSGASILDHIDSRVKVVQISPFFFLRRRVQRLLNAIQPDIVHAHLRKPTRILASCHTQAAKISTLHIGVNGPQFLAMDGLIAISPWQLAHVPTDYRGEVQWIRNSLSPHTQPAAEKIATLRHELGADDTTFLIGGIGRQSHSKGWDTLIKAFALAKLPNSRVILIGEGREHDALVQLARALNIGFFGFKKDVKDYYAALDLFVCPSRNEPMGRVILEAMDAGTPVIAADVEGPRDILAEYPGTLFPVDDVERLAQALKEAHAARENSGRRQRPDLSPHYVSNTSAQMLAFYQRCQQGRKVHSDA